MAKRNPTAVKGKLVALARPEDLDTREGLAAFYEALTGERPSEQELDQAFAEDDDGGGVSLTQE